MGVPKYFDYLKNKHKVFLYVLTISESILINIKLYKILIHSPCPLLNSFKKWGHSSLYGKYPYEVRQMEGET